MVHISDARILRESGATQNRTQTPPALPVAQNSQTDLPPDQKVQALQAAIEKLIRRSVPSTTKLQIHRDKESGTVIYSSVDTTTGEVIRQWPSEELIKLREAIKDLEGMLLDQRV